MENNDANVISKQEEKDLKKELDDLVNIERKKVIEELKVARSFGDLSENAEYDSARKRQAVVEMRIAEIEEILKTSTIVAAKKNTGLVVVGSTVDVEMKGGKNETFVIGKAGKGLEVSMHSPIAEGLLGKSAGDTVRISTPGGVKEMTVRKIQ